MAKRRKITDEREARRCLAAACAAGGDLGSWARANGIDGRSLNTWRMNLARRGASAKAPGRGAPAAGGRATLVELVPGPASSPGAPAAPRRYAVQVGDARVEFGDDFDPRTLRRVLEVLRTC